MSGNDEPRKATGPLPTVFVGAGPGAERTLAEFCRLAQGLTAPIGGPFGLVLADAQGDGLFTCDWPWASELRFPEAAWVRERCESIGRDQEKLVTSLSFLLRRLRSMEPGADPAPAGRAHLSSYVVIDLSDRAAVDVSIRLMQVLRQVDTAVDTTVLALTARTATTDSAGDGQWFETWKRLLDQLQDGLFAQRIYVLDGCDVDKTWFERPEQMYRLGAEFLFYHGLTCRSLLRQNERARTGVGESVLTVCGSFGCRTISADLSVVAERLAERLAQEDLADLYNRTVSSDWLIGLQEQARALVDRIAAICERAYQAKVSPVAEHRGSPQIRRSENAEVADAIRRTIKQVCSREPLVSLCLFLQLLRPKLARLLTQQRLWERARTRQLVVETFRRQEENTYEPLRTWLAQPETHWADRFTPAPPRVCDVAVSRPAAWKNYVIGWLVLALGLAAVALGAFWPSRLLAAAGGLISLAASVLMSWPLEWTWYPRSRLVGGGSAGNPQEEQRKDGETGRRSQTRTLLPSCVPGFSSHDLTTSAVSYRKGPTRQIRTACLVLGLAGLIGVVWPWWPDAWTPARAVEILVLAVLAALGLASVAGGPSRTRTDQVSPEEAPGHVNPPVWPYRVAGLLLLALTWTGLCLNASPPAMDTVAQGFIHLAGLVLVATGVGLALWPRAGRTHLVDRVARMPQPLTGGIARPVQEEGLPRPVTAMASWINGLALEPDQCLERFRGARIRQSHETLLDFLAADWESQLTGEFRKAIETRSGKSLQTLALQPVLWAQCVTSQLQDPHGGGADLSSLFALQAVKAWIESHSLAELLSLLHIDLARLGGLLGRLAPAHWPTPRVDPEKSASVIAAGKPLQDVVARASALAPRHPPEGGRATRDEPAVVLLDWDACDDRIVVLRTVQGLNQGWRGFPGMPGQPH